MFWITHALAFIAGGTVGAVLMTCMKLAKMEDDLAERVYWDRDDRPGDGGADHDHVRLH
jgi:hypothetical protein